MKTTLLFMVVALTAWSEDVDKSKLSFTAASLVDTYVPATCLSIACQDGYIVINFKTGEVTLPKGTTMPVAAQTFWAVVSRAFPEMQRAMRSQQDKVQWSAGDKYYEWGMRDDGIVVWREKKKP